MLNKVTFANALIAIKEDITDPQEKVLREKSKSVLDQLRSGEMDMENYGPEMVKELQGTMDEIHSQVLDAQGQALADYLNGMRDWTGDGPLKPFTLTQTRPFFEDLAAFSDITDAANVNPAIVDAKWAARWLALFPISFNLIKLPPGAITKVSSIAPAPVVPLSALTFYIEPTGTFEGQCERLAAAFHVSASSVLHIINFIVPGTPPVPITSPPIKVL